VAYTVKSGGDAVKKAKGWIGTAYCWGGGHAGPVPVGTCVDCSGLVNQVYGTSGNTFTQVAMGSPIASVAEAGPGDLIFFGPLAPGEPHHVGIYVGSNQMIDAPHTGTSVRQESIQGFGPINAIRRLVPTNANAGDGVNATGPMFNYAQLEGIWILAGGNAQYAAMAAAIAMAESGGNANASGTNSNGSIDRGLWQINSSNGSGSSFDVMTNARTAVFMSSGGTNWRPWCTAYSDGACGTKGGCYQCPGSPYLKFYNAGIAPDTSVNINATNAAANLTSGQGAQTTSILGDNAFTCILQGPQACFNAGGSSADALAGGIIKGIMHSILNPIINPIIGAMGVTAGVVMMAGGVWILIGRPGGQIAGQGVRGAAILAGGPEVGAVVGRTGGERAAYVSMTSQRRAQEARGQGRTQAANIRTQQRYERQEEQAVREQLRRETLAYQEWLRRTRPRGGGSPPPRQGQPPPRQGTPSRRRVIPVRSTQRTRSE
jgi:Lysozyme like domain/NlpC/P60 family